ncbi:SETX helicase, partial [Amia calva]|nr:SETX helicase [Amia calva]
MSTCRWCTPVGFNTTELLQKYSSGSLSKEEERAANEDLCYCLECVVEYHRARDELPSLHKRLWELETSRLIDRFAQSSKKELEEDDDLFIVEDEQEIQVPKFTGPEYENFLRVPLYEVLKYSYLMLHPQISEMCVEALCKMETMNSFQVFDKHSGIYLLLVHPNEMVRKWAIHTARSLGKVDRDDFYDLQDVFSCMFRVIELDIFMNSDIYSSLNREEGKMVLLPPHLYDSTNYKNYWLGICMLLTVLDAEAMDSLLLGHEKQNDFMQSILNTMEKSVEDENLDPFWPALQCFMVILDRLGSKIWGKLIEPARAFQTITGSSSYNREIDNIRRTTTGPKIKVEPENDDMVTCSQIVYDCNTKERSKDTSIRSTLNADGSAIMFEEMHSLVSVLQSEMVQEMRVHNSTFLWFIPFVQSVMDLKDLSIVYIGEIIHFLCGEIKDLINGRIQNCDKVTEFFTLILVLVIELHLNKNCMNILYYSAPKWIEVIVKCATLPSSAFSYGVDICTARVSSTSSTRTLSRLPQVSSVVPQQCIRIIRTLLREGCKLSTHNSCIQFLDMLNKQLRESSRREWILSRSHVQDLQACLKQLVNAMKDKPPTSGTDAPRRPSISIKDERSYEDCGYGNQSDGSSPSTCSDDRRSWSLQENRALKEEPIWQDDYDQASVTGSEDSNQDPNKKTTECLVTIKKEVTSPSTEMNSELMKESKLSFPLTILKPDPWQLQDLKSRLSSDTLLSKLSKVITKQPFTRTLSDGENSLEGQKEQVIPGPSKMTSKQEQREIGLQKSVTCNESTDSDDDDVPLSDKLSFLRAKKVKKNKKRNVLTDSQVDRELQSLSVAAYAKSTNFPVASMIVISDSESCKEDHDNALISSNETGINFRDQNKISIKDEPTDPRDCEEDDLENGDNGGNEYDSQLFEFETNDEIFSAWEDSQINTTMGTPEKQDSFQPESVHSSSPDLNEMYNDWGYETDFVPDDLILKASEHGEEQIKNQQDSKECTKESTEKELSDSLFHEEKIKKKNLSSTDETNAAQPSSSCQKTLSKKLAEKRASFGDDNLGRPKSSLANPKNVTKGSPLLKLREMAKTSKSNDKKASATMPSKETFFAKFPSPTSSTPAIVPPRKVRQPVEPNSTAEKLGLKKKERKAFELSQRSLNSVAQLRSYGQHFQVDKKKQKRRTKKPMLISPQKLVVRGNRKMLASQDLQFFRQSRNKASVINRTRTVKQSDSSKAIGNAEISKTTAVKEKNVVAKNLAEAENHEQCDLKTEEIPSVAGTSHSANEQSTLTTVISGRPQMEELQVPGNGLIDEDDNEDANMYLTQMDPVDMELCSEDQDNFPLTQREPVDMEIDEREDQDVHEAPPKVDRSICEKGYPSSPANTSAVTVAHKPIAAPQKDDHVFLKPGMPPSFLKTVKPSTTKIYAPSSRSATLVQEMEKISKPLPPTSKTKIVRPQPRPPRNSIVPPLHSRPAPVLVPPSVISYQPLNSYSRQAPVQTNPMRIETSAPKEAPPLAPNFNFDQNFLIMLILKWTHEMFCNFSHFGSPDNLCPFPLKEVPSSFKTFDDYFNTFFPLLVVNSFEELVQDWIKNTQSRRILTHMLNLTGIEYSTKASNASFTVPLRSNEVERQLYPKEDDLVFLWLPQNTNAYVREDNEVMEPIPCLGCVSRSNLSFGGECPTLILTIQTRGNVSAVHNQPVKCELVGSLISTLREFKALYLLKTNRMARALYCPHVSFFRAALQDKDKSMNMPEFNADQIKAINCGLAMIKQQQRNPKICLIHGPPGTGKTKTIVGLLQRIFSEDQENLMPMENRPFKGRKLRVLLCAPSNAAVDHLMRKIILDFKEKCRDIQNPLGNCGDINLVRLGMEKAISRKLTAFSLDSQTKLRTQRGQQGHDMDINRRKEQLDQQIDKLSRMCALNQQDRMKLTDEKCRLLKEREQLGRQLRESRSRKQETQAKVLQDAHIICCTLSTSGSMLLESAFRRLGHDPFSCVIVDEVSGQATETETLIPLVYRCPALVLVGDPEQLPPTVVSQKAKEKRFDQSLMARLWKCLYREVKENPGLSSPVMFLSTQYRMHPDICEFPSRYIYNKSLKTDGKTAERRCGISWPFQPYRLFDVTDGYETKETNGDSFTNLQEVKLAMFLIKLICEKQIGQVGVITHYSAQKQKIQEYINRELKKEHIQCVEVDTVDGFQGQEKDCIIVSCVRASSVQGSIGFLGSRQRLNVTLTRAKFSLFILGHLKTLRDQKDWGALIQDACKRGTIIKTQERSYREDAKQIFKPEPSLQRSLSFPPKEANFTPKPSLPAEARRMSAEKPATFQTAQKPVQAERRQVSVPLALAAPAQGHVSGLAHTPAKPSTSEKPRDPRLASRNKDTALAPPASRALGGSASTVRQSGGTDKLPHSSTSFRSQTSGTSSSSRSATEERTSSSHRPSSKYQDSRYPCSRSDRNALGSNDSRTGWHDRSSQKRSSDTRWSQSSAKQRKP